MKRILCVALVLSVLVFPLRTTAPAMSPAAAGCNAVTLALTRAGDGDAAGMLLLSAHCTPPAGCRGEITARLEVMGPDGCWETVSVYTGQNILEERVSRPAAAPCRLTVSCTAWCAGAPVARHTAQTFPV